MEVIQSQSQKLQAEIGAGQEFGNLNAEERVKWASCGRVRSEQDKASQAFLGS